ncbi:MAG TPA: hypothetical protein VL687_06505 [Methylomirabilota bacterium]|nr:hypothetical protein [Methylomirabilota bacterium]
METLSAPRTPLQADLVAMLRAMRDAERDLFDAIPAGMREVAGSIGEWSVKDVWAHLAAWRAVEARRIAARAGDDDPRHASDPPTTEPVDESNATLQVRHAEWTWEAVAAEASASVDALIAAIERSSTDVLCECDDGSVAGIGANGVNHAVGHLPEISDLAGDRARFDAFSDQIEAILAAGHLPPRDSGVLLYNIACARALSGELDDARRLLRSAFSRRHDLAELAKDDPDLVALHGELNAS